MDTRTKLLNRVVYALFGLLLLTLMVGVLVPVYTDEVAWRFQISRYLQDGLDRATGETCGLNTLAAPAWFMVPLRIFSSTVTGWLWGPLAVRLAGIAMAIAALVAMLGIIRRQYAASDRRTLVMILVIALLGTGVLPFLLVWSRPDQPIWLAMVGSLWLGFGGRAERSGREPLWRIAAITVLALIAFGYHVKGVFYLPVFVLAIMASARDCPRYRVRAVAFVILAVCTWSAYRYWSGRFACPDDPILSAKLQQENIMMVLRNGGLSGLPGAVPALLKNMLPGPYLHHVLPAASYMSDWLPAAPVPPFVLLLWRIAVLLAWYVAALLGAVLLYVTARDPSRRLWPLIAALVLAGCATGWAMLQLNKNAYESSVYMPVMTLALAFLWFAPTVLPTWLKRPVLAVAALSVISQLLLIGSYAAPLWAAGRGGGYIAGQPFSLSAFAYPRAHILAAGAKCGIVRGPKLHRVLIDDSTYFAYADSATPMHRLGVLSVWNGNAGDPMTWMRRHDSPGAVLACAYMPPELRAKAIATGEVCCVSTR
ncbi:hypothetical protein [Sphingomonas sp. PB4P5]|uniref:hypothetical protein n=1 Tax=Parasphingomonas puruogangriensis TaxID=3096155 RepID=UPI002FC690C1